jgi:hypothetical protein
MNYKVIFLDSQGELALKIFTGAKSFPKAEAKFLGITEIRMFTRGGKKFT